MPWRASPASGTSRSTSSGIRPGTRAGCRMRRAACSTCGELHRVSNDPTLRATEELEMAPRPRPQVIKLTDAAAERIKFVMANAVKPVVGVRVGVKNGGCAGMAYTMDYAETVQPSDEVVEDKGVRVMIDAKAILFLIGTEMDYKTEKLSAQFVFNNPNQTSACGCGESVQLKPSAEAH